MEPNYQHQRLRANIGCGATPTPGWLNFDNSLTVRLATAPWLLKGLRVFGVLEGHQVQFAVVARSHGIRWANAAHRIPLPDRSVDAIYSSHMIEHLDVERELPLFLAEVRRVLVPTGIVRLAVPDLRRRAEKYLERRDADEFVASLHMADHNPRTVRAHIRSLILGPRNHRWMYDAKSLIKILNQNGLCNPQEMPPGKTSIIDPGMLDLREREEESVYVEASSSPLRCTTNRTR